MKKVKIKTNVPDISKNKYINREIIGNFTNIYFSANLVIDIFQSISYKNILSIFFLARLQNNNFYLI